VVQETLQRGSVVEAEEKARAIIDFDRRIYTQLDAIAAEVAAATGSAPPSAMIRPQQHLLRQPVALPVKPNCSHGDGGPRPVPSATNRHPRAATEAVSGSCGQQLAGRASRTPSEDAAAGPDLRVVHVTRQRGSVVEAEEKALADPSAAAAAGPDTRPSSARVSRQQHLLRQTGYTNAALYGDPDRFGPEGEAGPRPVGPGAPSASSASGKAAQKPGWSLGATSRVATGAAGTARTVTTKVVGGPRGGAPSSASGKAAQKPGWSLGATSRVATGAAGTARTAGPDLLVVQETLQRGSVVEAEEKARAKMSVVAAAGVGCRALLSEFNAKVIAAGANADLIESIVAELAAVCAAYGIGPPPWWARRPQRTKRSHVDGSRVPLSRRSSTH
jgi:hypothetical protein